MADLELTTTATVPTNTSVTVTVYEDTNSDGTAENQASQSIADGTNTYTLTGFDGSSGNDVWVQIGPANSDVTTTASVDSVSVAVAFGGEITIDGTPVQNITIDGTAVTEVTVDGDRVF